MASPVIRTRTDEIDWNEIGTQWRHREYGALAQAISDHGLKVKDVEDLLDAADSRSDEHATKKVLEDAFAAAPDPVGELLFALYVYGRCLEKWEDTEHYEGIRTVLRALEAAQLPPNDASADARALLSKIVSQAGLLNHAMGVEEAMNCSCPVAMGKQAGLIVKGLEALPQHDALGDGLAEPQRIVQSDATKNRRYFEAIAAVAAAVGEFVPLNAPRRSRFDFGRVLKVLEDAESTEAIKGDVYESELRAHRVSLEALHDRAKEPHLLIRGAELVYLYPFALEGQEGGKIDAKKTVTRALDKGVEVEWPGADPGERDRLTAHELDRNDIWVGEPGYSCASIELPTITVTTTAGNLLEFTAEVRLSRLGNHHVRVSSKWSAGPDSATPGSELGNEDERVWSPLGNARRPASLHEVNQALRRGSHGMGAETLTFEGHTGKPWTKFPHYADDVIKAIAKAFDAKHVINLNATFHVVLAARSISVQRSYGSTPPFTLTELEQAVGASLLFHPVRHLATSLEEWIRYPPPNVTNLLEEQGYAGDLVARTDNTTVTYMPASPEWVVDEYQEMIEFVASIPPLLTLWDNQALRLAGKLDNELSELKEQMQIGQLYKREMEIRKLESDIRQRLAYLGSPALCRTRAQRQFLDNLWNAAGLPALERELDQRLILLAESQQRIAVMVSSIDERNRREHQEREERNRLEQGRLDEKNRLEQEKQAKRLETPVKIVIGLLGVASLAEVLGWMNQAFVLEGRWWAWREAATLCLIVFSIGVLYWYVYYYRDRKPPE